jgi:hypothetical protein
MGVMAVKVATVEIAVLQATEAEAVLEVRVAP